MMIYPRDEERAIRQQRMVEDWTKSGLLQPEQRERMIPELQVDLRRTNRFLRITLFIFGYMIVNSLVGLFALFLDISQRRRHRVVVRRGGRILWAGAVDDHPLSALSFWD